MNGKVFAIKWIIAKVFNKKWENKIELQLKLEFENFSFSWIWNLKFENGSYCYLATYDLNLKVLGKLYLFWWLISIQICINLRWWWWKFKHKLFMFLKSQKRTLKIPQKFKRITVNINNLHAREKDNKTCVLMWFLKIK